MDANGESAVLGVAWPSRGPRDKPFPEATREAEWPPGNPPGAGISSRSRDFGISCPPTHGCRRKQRNAL